MRPDQMVAIQLKICTPLGIAIIMLAAVKKLVPISGSPAANIWWTHSPNAMNAVATSATARSPTRPSQPLPLAPSFLGRGGGAPVGLRRRVAVRAVPGTASRTDRAPEALTAASVAALTVYDMAKAVDKGLEITGVKLVEKTKQAP